MLSKEIIDELTRPLTNLPISKYSLVRLDILGFCFEAQLLGLDERSLADALNEYVLTDKISAVVKPFKERWESFGLEIGALHNYKTEMFYGLNKNFKDIEPNLDRHHLAAAKNESRRAVLREILQRAEVARPSALGLTGDFVGAVVNSARVRAAIEETIKEMGQQPQLNAC